MELVRRSTFVLAAGAAVLAAALPAAAQAPTPLRLGQAVNGTLASEPVANGRGRFDVYSFSGREGQSYVVTMRSSAFDSFLTVGRTVSGITDVVKTDDDGGGESNARLRVKLPASGTFLVVAQSLAADGEGAYTLQLDTAPTPVVRPPRAVEVGQTVTGALEETDGLLEEDDTYYDLYTINARAGQRLSITMSSDDFDTYLAFGKMDGAEFEASETDDDGAGEGTNSRIRVTIAEAGRYVIRANSLGSATGSYTLKVEERAAPVPARPVAIAAGPTVNGELTDSDAQLDDESFYDLYTYRGRAGERLTIIMRSEAFDTFVAFGRMVNGEFQEMETGDDGADGTNTKLEVTLDADDEFVIRANSLGGNATGTYTIQVETSRER